MRTKTLQPAEAPAAPLEQATPAEPPADELADQMLLSAAADAQVEPEAGASTRSWSVPNPKPKATPKVEPRPRAWTSTGRVD
ncbi:hypothetical protein FB474_2359 [Oryzihumus leptocrescens]|uniref:Uncharacterized protein n=1 Tax=Oryzihumus leptocrescens TaxID=297536 RepID=A0A542ZKU0_9MICO|nr:hypothetical protein FB474_2359 [Oryzihumus leptocrescens]